MMSKSSYLKTAVANRDLAKKNADETFKKMEVQIRANAATVGKKELAEHKKFTAIKMAEITKEALLAK